MWLDKSATELERLLFTTLCLSPSQCSLLMFSFNPLSVSLLEKREEITEYSGRSVQAWLPVRHFILSQWSSVTLCMTAQHHMCACAFCIALHFLSPSLRLNLPRTSEYSKSAYSTIMPTASDLSAAADSFITQGDRQIIWRSLLHKEPTTRSFDQSNHVLWEASVWQRGSRGRRHANNGGGRGHGHLMRVGCVLGTCQVQNLSHRLYQLIGQSGRDNSSPMNPRSPHSYG